MCFPDTFQEFLDCASFFSECHIGSSKNQVYLAWKRNPLRQSLQLLKKKILDVNSWFKALASPLSLWISLNNL